MKRRLTVYVLIFAIAFAELIFAEKEYIPMALFLCVIDSALFGTLFNACIDFITKTIDDKRLADEKKRTLKTIRVHAKVIRVYETTDEIKQEKSYSLFNRYVKDVKGGGSHTVIVFEDDSGNRYSFADIDIPLVAGDDITLTLDEFKQNRDTTYGLKMLNRCER